MMKEQSFRGDGAGADAVDAMVAIARHLRAPRGWRVLSSSSGTIEGRWSAGSHWATFSARLNHRPAVGVELVESRPVGDSVLTLSMASSDHGLPTLRALGDLVDAIRMSVACAR